MYAPSPCGVLVLKCRPCSSIRSGSTCFRPLAGFWFLNSSLQETRPDGAEVSVPLRGSPILASPVATGEVASNASRWGRLCLACTSDAMKVYSLRPWRPLRHTACATSPALAGEARGTLRPLAGFWFLNSVRNEAERWVDVQVSVPLRGSGS